MSHEFFYAGLTSAKVAPHRQLLWTRSLWLNKKSTVLSPVPGVILIMLPGLTFTYVPNLRLRVKSFYCPVLIHLTVSSQLFAVKSTCSVYV